MMQTLGNVLKVMQMLNKHLPYQSIQHLGICQGEVKTYVHKMLFTSACVTSFIMAPN